MSRRDDLDPLTRAVSDTLDEILVRHHGILSSWSNPEDFLKWLDARGYVVRRKPVEPTDADWADYAKAFGADA